jgi:hypothetical protein
MSTFAALVSAAAIMGHLLAILVGAASHLMTLAVFGVLAAGR